MIIHHKGDLLKSDCNVIVHQVNCQGVMGSGIAKQIKETYPSVFEQYRKRYLSNGAKLGEIDICNVGGDRMVVNLYSQDKYLPRGVRHTNYEAFKDGLTELKKSISYWGSTNLFKIGFPYRIGCGLGGGDWKIVRRLIEEVFPDPWQIQIWEM